LAGLIFEEGYPARAFEEPNPQAVVDGFIFVSGEHPGAFSAFVTHPVQAPVEFEHYGYVAGWHVSHGARRLYVSIWSLGKGFAL
jgi:hypothetical protein